MGGGVLLNCQPKFAGPGIESVPILGYLTAPPTI
jgi:hypothetical protein